MKNFLLLNILFMAFWWDGLVFASHLKTDRVCENDPTKVCKRNRDCGKSCALASKKGRKGKCEYNKCIVPPTDSPTTVPGNLPCPPPGLEALLDTYEKCLCFYSLATSGLELGNSSTYDKVFTDDSVQHYAQTGSYYGPDGIAEYLSFVSSGEFVLNVIKLGEVFLNMEFLTSTGQCIATVASRVRYPFNPKYLKDNKDMCVDTMNGAVLYYVMTGDANKPIIIKLLHSWLPDAIISGTVPWQDTPATAEYVCNVIRDTCNYNLTMEQCLDKYDTLPMFDTVLAGEESFTYIDGNSKGCRMFHSFYASTNPTHCPHVSFEAGEDANGYVKCNQTKGVLVTDLFTEKELGLFYYGSHLLGLGDAGIDIKMEACTYE